jgi:thymidylate synthase
MINEKMNYVETYNIGDAWREVMWLCLKKGYDYVVAGKTGSYIGQIRKQLENVTIKILEPGKRPLAPIMPPNIPPPTTDENIEKYFLEYIMSKEIHGNEDYTYGSYIEPQLPYIIEKLIQSKGNTNQATISIGDREASKLADPPCLRVIDFKVVNGYLHMSIFFRSWDLFCGMPENLGGLQMLKEYVLANIENEFPVLDGQLIAYSSGLHLYEQYFDLVKMLNYT